MAKKSRDNILIPKATTSVTYKQKVANFQPTNSAVTNKANFENKLIPVKKTTPLTNFEPLVNQAVKKPEPNTANPRSTVNISLPSITNITCTLGPTDSITIDSDKCVTVILNENITEQKYIKNISGAESICVGTVNYTNCFSNVVSNISQLGFDVDTGLNVVCLSPGLAKVFNTGVTGLNNLGGSVTLSAGNNIAIGSNGNTLTICGLIPDVVTGINSLIGDITLSAGNNISIGTSGNTLTFCSIDTTTPATPTTFGSTYALNQTSLCNTFVGYCAGNIASTGVNNIAVGKNSLVDNTTGNNNVAIGTNALASQTGNNYGYGNVAIGKDAMFKNITGYGNVAIGDCALYCSNGLYVWGNVGIGYAALKNNITGGTNIAIGYGSLESGTGGDSNIAIGTRTFRCLSAGGGNVALGHDAGFYLNQGCLNIAIGRSALKDSICGNNNNIGIGFYTLRQLQNATDNIALGFQAGFNNTSGSHNLSIGCFSLLSNITGSCNIAIGVKSLYGSYGDNNISIGSYSGCNITTGTNNTVIGQLSGTPGLVCTVLVGAGTCERVKVDNTGLYINGVCWSSGGSVVPATPTSVGTVFGLTNQSQCNAFLGYCAGNATMTGNWNVAIGTNALALNSGGYYNVAIGNFAGYGNQIAIGNVAIGAGALCCNKLNYNTAVGYSALQVTTTGYGNTSVGSYAAACNSTGCFNTTVGFCAGYCVSSGTRNVLLGACAGNAITTGAFTLRVSNTNCYVVCIPLLADSVNARIFDNITPI